MVTPPAHSIPCYPAKLKCVSESTCRSTFKGDILCSRGRGSQRVREKATFPSPRTPTPSGFLAKSAKMGQKKAWFSQMSVRIRFGTPFDRQKQCRFSKCRSTKRKTHVLTDKRSYNMRFTGHQPNGIVRLSNQNTKKSFAAREYLWIDWTGKLISYTKNAVLGSVLYT